MTALPKPLKVSKAPRPLRRSSSIKRGKRPRRERKTPLAALKREFWKKFATYVKTRDGNVCVTCRRPGLEGRNWQAGHWIRKEGHGRIAYDPKNVHSQCGYCNLRLRGDAARYAQRVLDMYGEAEMRRMLNLYNETKEWKRYEIEYLIAALDKGGAEYEIAYYERYL